MTNLDTQLSELGLTIRESPKEINIVEQIRRSRRIEYAEPRIFNLNQITGKIKDVSERNKKIEKAVKFEVLGLKDNLPGRISYSLWSLFRQNEEPAEAIIQEQIQRVEGLNSDLVGYSDIICNKIRNLDTRYDNILISLVSKHQETEEITRHLNEKRDLLSLTSDAVEKAEDFVSKLNYARAQRELRKGMNTGIHQIRLNDIGINQLKGELPILDSLVGIAEAYSFTLKEIYQESSLMNGHLEAVSTLYLDMMRSQRINLGLEEEISKLFGYTRNIARALEDGTKKIIDTANNKSIVQNEFRENSTHIYSSLQKVEDATFSKFNDLEGRLEKYSNRLKGGDEK